MPRALAACLLAVAALLVTPGTAQAQHVDKKLTFTCPFPLIGKQTLAVEVQADFDVPAAPGGTLTTSGLAVAVSVPDKATRGLALVGSASIEGTASAGVTVANGSLTVPLQLPLAVAKTPVPAAGEFTTHATGSVPQVKLPNPGKTTLTIGDFSTRLTPRKADSSFTGLGSFTSDCVLDPGQDPVLLSFDLGTAYDFGITGQTKLKGLTAPLSGEFAFTTAPAFTGGATFAKTHADFKLFGFVPGGADLEFTPDGSQTGELIGGGFVAHGRYTLAVPLITLFGLPVGDPACRTSTSFPVDLSTGPGFDLATGGPATGGYTLPPFTGCGPFGAFFQGDGNTFALTLSKR